LIYIFNSTTIPTDVDLFVKIQKVSIEEAKSFLEGDEFTSAIDHEATAKFLSRILEVHIPTNPIEVNLGHGDLVLAIRLRGILQDYMLLSDDSFKGLPYDLFVMECIATRFIPEDILSRLNKNFFNDGVQSFR